MNKAVFVRVQNQMPHMTTPARGKTNPMSDDEDFDAVLERDRLAEMSAVAVEPESIRITGAKEEFV